MKKLPNFILGSGIIDTTTGIIDTNLTITILKYKLL